MRKPLALILGAMMALSLAPLTSRASSQCPGAVKDDPNAAGVSTGYKYGPIIRLGTGPAALPDNPANQTGLPNWGELVGCRSDYGQLTDGVVNSNWIGPGSQQGIVSVDNYPVDIDHFPAAGCIKFNATPSTLCNLAGEIKLSWHINNTGPQTCVCFRSQVFNIPGAPQSTAPGGTLTAVTCATLRPYQSNTASRVCRTYKDVNAP